MAIILTFLQNKYKMMPSTSTYCIENPNEGNVRDVVDVVDSTAIINNPHIASTSSSNLYFKQQIGDMDMLKAIRAANEVNSKIRQQMIKDGVEIDLNSSTHLSNDISLLVSKFCE